MVPLETSAWNPLIAPQAMVLIHLAAMFGPALLLRRSIARWSSRTLSIVCTVLLASGAALVLWAPAPLDLLGLTATHGAAWGLAWAVNCGRRHGAAAQAHRRCEPALVTRRSRWPSA